MLQAKAASSRCSQPCTSARPRTSLYFLCSQPCCTTFRIHWQRSLHLHRRCNGKNSERSKHFSARSFPGRVAAGV